MKSKPIIMSRVKKITSLLVFILIATSGMYAQVPPQGSQQPQQQQQVDVSDEDLNKFASAYQEVQTENQKSQEKMMAVIQEEGMELERFNEIQQASMNPNQEVDASENEKAKHKKVVAKIEKMQPALQEKMQEVITEHGLDLNQYQTIASALQSNQELQQKLQNIMMKQQQGE